MQPSCVALLVGSNPLPNYLAAATLRPRAVRLLYTPETEDVKNRLRTVFRSVLSIDDVRESLVDDATSAASVSVACKSALGDVDHLNYTGGTKVMAAQARMTFGPGREDRASYVDELRGCLRLDDDTEIAIESGALTPNLLLQLHGIDQVAQYTPPPQDPTAADVASLASILLAHPEVAATLHARIPDPSAKIDGIDPIQWLRRNPVDVTDLDLGLPFQRIPLDAWSNKNTKHWMKSLRGQWLEQWIATTVRPLVPGKELLTGVDTRLRGRPFECDVFFLAAYRPFLISCTTHSDIRLCKSKLFEAALRARQIGGDLARYGLVTFMPPAAVSQARGDVASVWDSPITPGVFGIEHLREWAGMFRSEANLDSLRSWIDQRPTGGRP